MKLSKGDIVFCNGDLEGTDYEMKNTVGVILERIRDGVYKVEFPYLRSEEGNSWLVHEDQMYRQGFVQ
jgi:hypothetical protein